MDTKLVALIALCLFLPLRAASAQNKPPSKEVGMSSRKLLLLATGPVLPVAHEGVTQHWCQSPDDSFVLRLLVVTLASICVIVAGILCRLRSQNPQIQSADLVGAETVRPNVSYNVIGSCFSVS